MMFHQKALPHPSRTLFQPEVHSKAVIKQAPIEAISPWVSQNVLRRGIRTGREHLPIGFNHVLEFAQELQVKYGKVCTLWYDATGSSGIMGLTFSSSAHVTKVNGRNMGLLFKLAEEWLTKAQIELKHTHTLAVVKELLTEVEQFLWVGHEMDPVRVVERTLAAVCN
ncbi:hypothetical protein CY35_16G051500 [Sphagnum magellanicum]|nr:hypothetical protein CY35_16G051500 [Sphagnum magellanicum]KAH9537397.1 hypothetical protein CY35_16G051500 [Sphagnum magellanicum]KAH9537404.1 hypothetical protein CY35_16G051500 [Sphagnum magellanicum]KAH9537411.1 hypothetical protein CY35_16G051500 [Sphagnum magellanicum]KAH9537412.1 hypothetical protein CY35_16G051500 [Sphagnum magellanicum]